MTFTDVMTRKVKNVAGDTNQTYGTYTSTAGGTGGDIDTGLKVCDGLMLQAGSASAGATAAAVNETFPVSGSAVTIVTLNGESGQWFAWGRG